MSMQERQFGGTSDDRDFCYNAVKLERQYITARTTMSAAVGGPAHIES